MVPTTVTVTDIAGQEGMFTLDRVGFQLCYHEIKSSYREEGYRDKDKVEAEYYPEMERLLKNV
jgi:hypothetical protein